MFKNLDKINLLIAGAALTAMVNPLSQASPLLRITP